MLYLHRFWEGDHSLPPSLSQSEFLPRNFHLYFKFWNTPLLERVTETVKWALLTSVRIFYYLAHPTLFSLGLFIGLVWDQKVQDAIDKIKKVWKNQNWASTFAFVGFACLSLPTTFIVSSLFMGASTGCDLYEAALVYP